MAAMMKKAKFYDWENRDTVSLFFVNRKTDRISSLF